MENAMKNSKVVVEKNGVVTRISYENDGASAYAGAVGSTPLVFPKFKKEKKEGDGEKKEVKKAKKAPAGEKRKKAAPKKEKEKVVAHFEASQEEMKERHEKAKVDMNAFGFSGLKFH